MNIRMTHEYFLQLNHNIDLNQINSEQICNKCNVQFIVFAFYIYIYSNSCSNSYFRFNEDKTKWHSIHLTCDEIIIKNIIE